MQRATLSSDPAWRFYGVLTWEQCQSLILAAVVLAIVVVPQWLFSFVEVPTGHLVTAPRPSVKPKAQARARAEAQARAAVAAAAAAAAAAAPAADPKDD
jgi:hypothetical protein